MKFVTYEKCSKKERKRRDALQRGTWHEFSPVTRVVPNKKGYDRHKAKAEARSARFEHLPSPRLHLCTFQAMSPISSG